MGKQNYFFSGITDILILAILCEHDSYVYEIVKFIKEKIKRMPVHISEHRLRSHLQTC